MAEWAIRSLNFGNDPLLSKATTGGGSMRRGFGTTARRPSTRYSLHLVLEWKYAAHTDKLKNHSHS